MSRARRWRRSEHALATRLYQNPARIHFDKRLAAASRFGRRLVYGGHVMSIARALSFEGLANAVKILAINGGRHVGAGLRRRHDLCVDGNPRRLAAGRAAAMSAPCAS